MRFIALAALATLVFLPQASAAPVPNGVFVDGSGAPPAYVSWDGPCNGPGTLTVTIDPLLAEPDVRVVSVESFMVPDLCLIACFECVVPFVWTFTNEEEGIQLAGGGVAPGEASLQGAFQEGALEIRAGIV